MKSQRLKHDVATAMSKAILDIFQNLLRPEEFRDAMEETYAAVKAGLEAYDKRREQRGASSYARCETEGGSPCTN